MESHVQQEMSNFGKKKKFNDFPWSGVAIKVKPICFDHAAFTDMKCFLETA